MNDKEIGGILFLIAMHLILYPILMLNGLTLTTIGLGETVLWGIFLLMVSIATITDKEYTEMKGHLRTYQHFSNLKESVFKWIDEYNREKMTNAETA